MRDRYRQLKSILLLGIIIFSANVYADPPEGYHFVDFNTGLKQARASGKNIFLYYGRYGCGFCDKTNKESFSDANVAKIYQENYVLVYVDAEGGKRLNMPTGEMLTEQQFGARLKVMVTPYFLMMNPQGEVLVKVPGYKTVQDFLKLHQFIAGEHYKQTTFANFSKD